MLQLVQSPKSGQVEHLEVPVPACPPGFVLVQTLFSAVSAGTERHTVRTGRQSLLRTALSRPDLVDRGLKKLKRDGIVATLRAVRARTQQTTALGYSSAGRVAAVGEGISDLEVGDVVACAGVGFASHAEFVAVPRNLTAKVPVNVKPEQAAFATLGAIALHGVRLSRAQLGENVAVIGLGIIGQLTVRLLVAAGCRVLAIDLDPERVETAKQGGAAVGLTADLARNPGANGLLPAGHGWDAAIVAADSSSNRPLELAAELTREKGRVVAVGLVRTDLPRQSFYDKELELIVSRSYGPGRYDSEFEIDGVDYPYPYVRWTETRNLEAFLDQIARGRIDVGPLISHRFRFEEARAAYRLLMRGQSQMGIVFDYGVDVKPRAGVVELARNTTPAERGGGVGFIGVGAFAQSVLLPGVAELGMRPRAIASRNPLSARVAGAKFGFERVCSSAEEVFADPDCKTVFIATPHAEHGEQVLRAIEAGKHVFVEKPLAVTVEEIEAIEETLRGSDRLLMVGFNRRFSPFARLAKEALAGIQTPFTFHYRVNAGPLPERHWLLEPKHGGRVIGEVCHFVDLMGFLADSPLRSVGAQSAGWNPALGIEDIQVRLDYANGCSGTISYLTSNRAPLAKERLDLWCGDRVIEMEDFRAAWFYSGGRERKVRWRRAEKGHREELAAFQAALFAGGPAPIPFEEIRRTSLATIEAVRSLATGETYRFE